MTRNGSFIPSVAFGSAGHVIYVDWTFDPTTSRILDCISSSSILLTFPLTTAWNPQNSWTMKMIYISKKTERQ